MNYHEMILEDYFNEGIFKANEYTGKKDEWDDSKYEGKKQTWGEYKKAAGGKLYANEYKGRKLSNYLGALNASLKDLKNAKKNGASPETIKSLQKRVDANRAALEKASNNIKQRHSETVTKKYESDKAKAKAKFEKKANEKYEAAKKEHDEKEKKRVARNKRRAGLAAGGAALVAGGLALHKWVNGNSLDEAYDIYEQGYYDALCMLEDYYDEY